jgi:hypothetical protein
MSQKLLQVNCRFRGVSKAELEEAWLPRRRPSRECLASAGRSSW